MGNGILFFPGQSAGITQGRRRQTFVAAAFLPFLGAGVLPAAVPASVVYVCDSSDDRILRLADRDGSGAVELEAPGEVAVFYDDVSEGPDLSTPAHLIWGGDKRLYLLDGGTLDSILALRDGNGDGDANDPGEVSVWYDASGGGPRFYTANALAPVEGGFYAADDGSSGKRLLRLRDANADGDALDPDEARVVYDRTALGTPLIEDPEALAAAGGSLYVADATLQAVFLLRDQNADDDYLDDAESVLFYQGPAEAPLGDVESLAAAEEGLYAADKTTGRVLLLRDTNADGDALDPGEAHVFIDDTAPVRVAGITEFLPLGEGKFLVLDNTKDAVFLLVDGNGDGDVLDEGEVVRWLLDDGSSFATPSGIAIGPPDTGPPPDPQFIRGDTTGNGALDISDPIATLGYLFLGRTVSGCLDALDADDSGSLTISDAVYTLNYLFVGGTPLPPPFPAVGPDPTADEIRC